jgi:hypothetical protein
VSWLKREESQRTKNKSCEHFAVERYFVYKRLGGVALHDSDFPQRLLHFS